MIWRKSSHSAACGNCVEVASHGVILIRDSKNPGAQLAVTAEAWRELLAAIKRNPGMTKARQPGRALSR